MAFIKFCTGNVDDVVDDEYTSLTYTTLRCYDNDDYLFLS